MRRAAKIGLGCLFAPLGLAVLALVLVGSMRAMGVPESRIADLSETQSIPEQARTALVPRTGELGDVGGISGVQPALRVFLDLDMGHFRIETGPADQGIVVDASFDEGTYDLQRNYAVESGVPTFRLSFRSKIHWLRRLVNTGSFSDGDLAVNEITIFLPEGIPLDLRMKLQRSESEIDVSGLALTHLVTQLGMGSYELSSRIDNPVVLQQASFDLGMGEVRLVGMSHLRARNIEVKGGMGEIHVDFGTSLLTDTELHARMRMGEMRLSIPDDAILDPDSDFRAVLGELDESRLRGRPAGDPELAKRLRVSGSVLMGQFEISEFSARGLGDAGDQR